MSVRCVLVDAGGLLPDAEGLGGLVRALRAGADPPAVGMLLDGIEAAAARPELPEGVAFRLLADQLGVAVHDPVVVQLAAGLAGCRPSAVLVASDRAAVIDAAEAGGARSVAVGPGSGPGGPDLATVVGAALARCADEDRRALAAVGVGPHPEPWPDDDRLDPALLAAGDRRNVEDRFRYWREDAIVAELDRTRIPLHVAVENWQHDLNIGTVVRNANAFNVAGVHIVGRRRWNRRGAMATDRYLRVTHHPDVGSFAAWAVASGLPIVGIDNVPGARPLEADPLPSPGVLAFGQEGPGLSAELLAACAEVRSITQLGSTRSLNAGVASGIAIHWWVRSHTGA